MVESKSYWPIIRSSLLIGGAVGVQGWLIESMSSDKLIGIGGLFTDAVESKILGHGLALCLGFGLIALGTHIYSQWAANKSQIEATMSRICQHIFNRYVKDSGVAPPDQFKVSFMVPIKCFKRPLFPGVFQKREERLFVKGRYQTRAGKKKTRVSFSHSEGSAGRAYFLNRTTHMKLTRAFDEENPEEYYRECEKNWGLSRRKARRLNDKVAYILSIPVKYHGAEQRVGVVTIDCLEPVEISGSSAKKAEQAVSHYSAIFKLKE